MIAELLGLPLISVVLLIAILFALAFALSAGWCAGRWFVGKWK